MTEPYAVTRPLPLLTEIVTRPLYTVPAPKLAREICLNSFAASGMSVLTANFESGRISDTCAVTELPDVSASPMFVRKRSDDSSCRSCSVPPEPAAWLGVTAGINCPYVPAGLFVYVRPVATMEDAAVVLTISDPEVC